MKYILSLVLFIISFAGFTQKSYEKEIKKYQYETNLKFQDKNQSPLTPKDRKKFNGLDFYTINKDFKVVATLTKTPNSAIFEIQTSTDRKPLYKKYGDLNFEINGENYHLNIYQNQDLDRNPMYKNNLFLPFLDKTSGNDSYAGGRYIDILTTDEKDGKIIIDFNKAYNPYCAYSGRYSCPVVPKENYLTTKIIAGVKTFKK